MSAIVLDASALLALLFGEPGADRVRSVLAESTITTVNFAEIVGRYARHGVSHEAIQALLNPLPVERTMFDQDLAYRAGSLLPITRSVGLSLGDRACLALAQRLDVPAMTADRAWAGIGATIGLRIDLIR